jgi:antitoxin HicB
MFEYPMLLTPAEEGGYIVTFPDVPEAITQGEDEQDARRHARDALESALTFYMDERLPLPAPTAREDLPSVSPDTLSCAKLALYQAMREAGIRKADLARRLDVAPTSIDRLLSLTHASKIEQIDAALAVLGKRLAIDMKEAA